MKNDRFITATTRAFTLLELLVVIGLLAVLSAIAVPGFKGIKETAAMSTNVKNLKEITSATLLFAADNGQQLPSPEYPGGYQEGDPNVPEQWDYTGTGTGLWLDGVIYHAMYAERGTDGETIETESQIGDDMGSHLKYTAFGSLQSFKRNPEEEDWYKHSYAMNKSLQWSHINSGTADPELTNKNLSMIPHRVHAMLFVENSESNVVGFGDLDDIVRTAKNRWSSGKAIAAFLDGSVRPLDAITTKGGAVGEFPTASRNSDDASSRFWSGVDADDFTGT